LTKENPPAPFADWISKTGIDISKFDKEALREEYYRRRSREEETQSKNARPFFMAPPMEVHIPLAPEWAVYRKQRADKVLENAQEKFTTSQRERHHIESEIARLRALVESFAYPANVNWGLIALGYLALVGVILPLALLPSEGYSLSLRILTVVLFSSGLIAVSIYIVTQVRELVKK